MNKEGEGEGGNVQRMAANAPSRHVAVLVSGVRSPFDVLFVY